MSATAVPLLPGGVGLTHLKVYDSVAPDGLPGGSPHMHFACTECYYVQAGHGRVQTLSGEGFAEIALEPGGVVWFSPGVIHRLINEDGALEIFVVMQNAGLPEAGDFVLTFPPDDLADPTRYFEAASLSPRGEVFASGVEAARRQRDLAVQGFMALRARWERNGPEALTDFYATALRLVHPKVAEWQEVWRRAPLAAAEATRDHLAALAQGETTHLRYGAVRQMSPPGPERRLGMCGTLGTYLPEGSMRG